MLKALISTSTFPVEPDDGIPRFVHDLSQSLAAHCLVTVLTPDAPGALRRERIGSVRVHRFTYFLPRSLQRLAYRHGIRENLRRSCLSRLQTLPYLAALVTATHRLVHSLDIDVVNSHWLVPQGLATSLVRKPSERFRHVLSVHAGDIYFLHRRSWGRRIAQFVVERSDRVLADGSHVRDALDDLLGRPSGALLQPMGVHVDLFRNGPEARLPRNFPAGYLVFVGRLTEKKGVTYLLRALPVVLERHPGLGLAVIGNGPLAGDLQEETMRLGLAGSVHFLGSRGHSEIASYLRGSRLAVVPSIVDRFGETEGMPTVVVEALAAGAAVVGTAVDGIPDVLRHRQNGWLCRPADPDHLAETILQALDDATAETIKNRGRLTASEFAWPLVADRYIRTFRLVETTDDHDKTRRPQ